MARYDAWGVEIGKRLGRQIDDQAVAMPGGLIAHSGPEVESPALGRMRRPDLLVIPEAVLEEEGLYISPEDVQLVAEVVSESNPDNDYTDKPVDYARMGVPTYLLIDPRKATVTVFSEPGPTPEGSRYRARHNHVFGDQVSAGPFTTDTSGFLPYHS